MINRDARFFLITGCLGALAGVACGAFGAHALNGRLTSEMLAAWQTANMYHFYHSLGLLVVGLYSMTASNPPAILLWAGRLMVIGLLLFSGSLYLLALTGIRALGAVTPLGGAAWIAAWALFAAAVWRRDVAAASPYNRTS